LERPGKGARVWMDITTPQEPRSLKPERGKTNAGAKQAPISSTR
jgi:hypothetical protein